MEQHNTDPEEAPMEQHNTDPEEAPMEKHNTDPEEAQEAAQGRIVRNLDCTMAVANADMQSVGAAKNPKLKAVPEVEIDKSGKFKYILIKVHDPSKEREFKHIVRGFSKANFHGDIYDEVSPSMEDSGLDCECLGGGRIHHEAGKKKIVIYGYSLNYGRANHSITARLLTKKYREYEVTWKDEGY